MKKSLCHFLTSDFSHGPRWAYCDCMYVLLYEASTEGRKVAIVKRTGKPADRMEDGGWIITVIPAVIGASSLKHGNPTAAWIEGRRLRELAGHA